MEVLFEILKYILPSAIVFLTVYLLLKNYFEQERFKMMHISQKERYQSTLPLKLQAYERLALFLERIRIPVLMLRFPVTELNSRDLCKTLMLGIQQEFEHNLVQQIYVSEQLWSIIVLTKDELMHEVDLISQQSDEVELTRHKLYTSANQNTSRMIDTALNAIKKEIQLIL
jgi:hypothetical protein